MANDVISLIVRANLALGAGVLVVLLLRSLARRWFGARVAYSLWLAPVLAAGACFLPPRLERLTITETLTPASSIPALSPIAIAQPQPAFWLAVWCAGFLLSVAILALRQGRFSRALGRLHPRADLGAGVFGAESSEHGPAVIGVLRPIIVTPADFDQRFSDEERRIVLAHERAHLAQGDPLINATVVAVQCANWFNPFVHIGARALRLDQELAADAAVLATSARRPIAEAILKTQIIAAAPLGAAWPPNSTHSLKERIAMLKRNLPSQTQRIIGVSAIALVSLGVCAAAWSAQPAHVVVSKAPHFARADAAPFVEPPVSDVAMLAGGPATGDEQQGAEIARQADYAKVVDTPDDESADDQSDQSDPSEEANADDASDNESDATVLSDEDRREMGQLSPEQRARIATQVRQAMAESRVAMAQARVAARAARTDSVRAAMATAREVQSPAMQAEIRALAVAAAQMARDTAMSEADREAMRAEIRAHGQRIRELARHACTRAHAAQQGRHDGDRQND